MLNIWLYRFILITLFCASLAALTDQNYKPEERKCLFRIGGSIFLTLLLCLFAAHPKADKTNYERVVDSIEIDSIDYCPDDFYLIKTSEGKNYTLKKYLDPEPVKIRDTILSSDFGFWNRDIEVRVGKNTAIKTIYRRTDYYIGKLCLYHKNHAKKFVLTVSSDDTLEKMQYKEELIRMEP